jgi:hypothetical protein
LTAAAALVVGRVYSLPVFVIAPSTAAAPIHHHHNNINNNNREELDVFIQ